MDTDANGSTATTTSVPVALCSFDELPSILFPLLRHIGPNISHDVPLLAKCLRLFKDFVRQQLALDSAFDSPLCSATENIIKGVLLPSISLLHINPAIVNEMWDVISVLPYESRYRIYHYWCSKAYTTHPGLILVQARVLSESKQTMRYVSSTLRVLRSDEYDMWVASSIADCCCCC
jgi:hypothetical protein